MSGIQAKYAIVGVGESGRSMHSGVSTLELAIQASRAALADAGLDPGDIDCVATYHLGDSVDSHFVAAHLGIHPETQFNISGGGGSLELVVAQVIGMIEAGMCHTALIYRSLNGRSGKRLGGSLENRLGGAFTEPYGMNTPGQKVAMVATRHLWETGMGEGDLAAVCAATHEHAQRNPRAILYGKAFTTEEYFASPYIATPFRKHDFCVETDEANAIIVTSVERAAALRQRPIIIDGVSARASTRHPDQFALPEVTEVGASYAASQVYRMAGLTPAEVQVAAFYDCFSWVILAQLEAYGFAQRGGSGEFVRSGGIGIDGALPANTAGGMSAEGYTNGMNNLIELVRQMRCAYSGTARQAARTEVGLSTGWNGPSSASALLMHR